MRSTDVSFPTADDVTLRGRLFTPAGDGVAPGVVLNHGFSATIGMGVLAWAERLAAAGYAALAYDNRCLGSSDGEPRGLIDWLSQARDVRDALAFLGAQPAVDPARLATWGSSFSGAQGAVVSTIDDRVKAAIAIVPLLGYSAEPTDDFETLRDQLLHGTQPTEGMPLDVHEVMPEPEAHEWFTTMRTQDWSRSVQVGAAGVDPGVAISHVGVPFLAILASEDRTADIEVSRALVQRVPGATVIELAGHHFTPYSGDSFEQAVAAAVGFLDKSL